MAIRIHCDIEGLEHNWIDVSERWTRAEFKQYLDAEADTVWDWWRSKVEGCHLEAEDGTVYDDPAQVDEDALDTLDLRLVGFVGVSMIQACSHLRSLGNAHARVRLDGIEPSLMPAQTHPEN